MLPLPMNNYDIGVVTPVRPSSQFRITIDTNRYSVPSRFSGMQLTLKTYPDRLCVYDRKDMLVARHTRSYDRNQDFENQDHVVELLMQRKKARAKAIYKRCLAISPRALAYCEELERRRLNHRHHLQKIVALSETYGADAVSRAIDDAFAYNALSCEYIANILEQRTRKTPEPSVWRLTRREDLLDIEVEAPDLDIYTMLKQK